AVPDTDHPVAVAHDDQRGKAEPPAALDHLGDPVDGDDPLQVSGALVGAAATAIVPAVTPFTAATTPRSSCHQSVLLSYVTCVAALTGPARLRAPRRRAPRSGRDRTSQRGRARPRSRPRRSPARRAACRPAGPWPSCPRHCPGSPHPE